MTHEKFMFIKFDHCSVLHIEVFYNSSWESLSRPFSIILLKSAVDSGFKFLPLLIGVSMMTYFLSMLS